MTLSPKWYEFIGQPYPFPDEGPWMGVAVDAARDRGVVEDSMARAQDAPDGPRKDAILGYLKAAERCLDGARRIAEGYYALREDDEAREAMPDAEETGDACDALDAVGRAVFEMEMDDDRKEQAAKKETTEKGGP